MRLGLGLDLPVSSAGAGRVWDPAEWRAAFIADVAHIGDSLTFDSEYEWKNVSFSDSKGLPLSVGFCTGQGITADSTGGGTLEYRASDAHMRWTAPGDTAGPWTEMSLGWFALESATAGKGVRIGIRSLTGLPGTDQTVTVNTTGAVANGWGATGFGGRAMHMLRWLNAAPKFLGLGGNRTAQVVEQLPWLEAQAGSEGVDIFCLATNDVSGEVALATVTANLTTILDARRALGRLLVIVGMPARWGADTSTPMTAGQIEIFDGVNAWLRSYAAQHAGIFVDAYTLTRDPGHDDRRPAAGMLRDTVHYAALGAQIVAQEVANKVAARTGYGAQRASDSAGNLLGTVGFMAGSSGTISTGVTGTAPTGWTIQRASGSDATAVASVYDRSDGVLGRWMQLDVTAGSGTNIIQARPANSTLAALGLSVGDTIYMEAELDISGVTGGLVGVDAFVQFTGTSPVANVRAQILSATDDRQGGEHSVRRSPPMKIPAGTTGLRFHVWIRTQDSATATVKVASCAIVKITP